MTQRDAALDPIVIGLTGPIAAGKSTVAAMLRQRGAQVIDADEVYSSLLTPGSPLLNQLVARFGARILRADGHLDRAALAEIVFSDPAALSELDDLTHPAVVAAVRRLIAQSRAPVVVIEAIKLAQSGIVDDVDQLWVVDAPRDVRLRRLLARPGVDHEMAEQRLVRAVDPQLNGARADVTIDASGDIEHTARKVAAAWDKLPLSSYHPMTPSPASKEER